MKRKRNSVIFSQEKAFSDQISLFRENDFSPNIFDQLKFQNK